MNDRDCELIFEEGLIGLPLARRFHLVEQADSPIYVLRCLDIPRFNVPVIDPFLVDPGYEPGLPRRVAEALGIRQPGDLLLLVVTTSPASEPALANLAAPLVINVESRRGSQVILDGNRYSVRAPVPLADEAIRTGCQTGTGGPIHACTEPQGR